MKWFWQRRTTEDHKERIDESMQQLAQARSKRRDAVQRLVQALDTVRIDEGLVKVGNDMLTPRKRVE